MSKAKPGLVLAAVGTVLGPTAGLLFESGALHVFQAMPLLNVWLVVLCGGLGLLAGIVAVRRGVVLVGAICLTVNGAVLGLYGFLATFFAFGGSR